MFISIQNCLTESVCLIRDFYIFLSYNWICPHRISIGLQLHFLVAPFPLQLHGSVTVFCCSLVGKAGVPNLDFLCVTTSSFKGRSFPAKYSTGDNRFWFSWENLLCMNLYYLHTAILVSQVDNLVQYQLYISCKIRFL